MSNQPRRRRAAFSVRPNPSLKRSANGRPPGPGPRYGVHFLSPGPGVLPLALRLARTLGSTQTHPPRARNLYSAPRTVPSLHLPLHEGESTTTIRSRHTEVLRCISAFCVPNDRLTRTSRPHRTKARSATLCESTGRQIRTTRTRVSALKETIISRFSARTGA